MREEMIETIAEFDDNVMTKLLEEEEISVDDIKSGIRNALDNHPKEVALVLAGSALKNRGIQPLMEAVVDYLPSPNQRLQYELVSAKTKQVRKMKASQQKLVGLAFKTLPHAKLGLLTYIRMYSGSILKGSPFFNSTQQQKEIPVKIYRVRADDYIEIENIKLGDIAAVSGLQNTKSGDTIMGAQDSVQYTMGGVDVPEPVFISSFEPSAKFKKEKFEEGVTQLMAEDPSFIYEVDEETTQMVFKGLGELHLQIMKDRLKNEYGIQGELAKLRVSYRETLQRMNTVTEKVIQKVQGYEQFLELSISVEPIDITDQEAIGQEGIQNYVSYNYDQENKEVVISLPGNNQIIYQFLDPQSSKDYVTLKKYQEGLLSDDEIQLINLPDLMNHAPEISVDVEEVDDEEIDIYDLKCISFSEMEAFEAISRNALDRGPLLSKQLLNTRITYHSGRFSKKKTTRVMIEMVTNNLLVEAFRGASPAKMEPIMDITLTCPEIQTQKVIKDLISARKGAIDEVLTSELTGDIRGYTTIEGTIPLEATIGYANGLRSLTSGEAHFTTRFKGYDITHGGKN